MAELKTTHARTWRKHREEGIAVALPSGKVCRVRAVAFDKLILSGKVPNLLTPIVYKILWAQARQETVEEEKERDIEEKKHMLELVNIIVPAALAYPRIVDDPQDEDEISLDDLQFGDKLTIFSLAKLPAEVLDRFLHEQTRDVQSIPASGEIQSATQQPA